MNGLFTLSPGPSEPNNQNLDVPLLPPLIHHEKRETRPKCSPRTYSAVQQRDFSVGAQDFNVTLYGRTMTFPGGTDATSMDTFMKDEITSELSDAIVWRKGPDRDPEDMATSTFREFQDKAFSLGTSELCGCTTLVIISRRAVYISHYWENISFATDEVWLTVYGTPQNAFQQTVIRGLTRGVNPNGSPPEQVSLRNQAGRLEDTYVRAYLMIPDTDVDENPVGYRPQWNAIKSLVNRFVPTLATGDRWREVMYTPHGDNPDLLKNTALGRLLFKYDPDQNGKKKATLWIEREATPYHDDEW